jgi:hypothetical protein
MGEVDWEPWFAWHPVIIGGQIVWLRMVLRQYRASWGVDWYEYRLQG